MLKHLKCAVKVLLVGPVLVFALALTVLQLFGFIIPLGILNLAGCVDADFPEPIGGPIIMWFQRL